MKKYLTLLIIFILIAIGFIRYTKGEKLYTKGEKLYTKGEKYDTKNIDKYYEIQNKCLGEYDIGDVAGIPCLGYPSEHDSDKNNSKSTCLSLNKAMRGEDNLKEINQLLTNQNDQVLKINKCIRDEINKLYKLDKVNACKLKDGKYNEGIKDNTDFAKISFSGYDNDGDLELLYNGIIDIYIPTFIQIDNFIKQGQYIYYKKNSLFSRYDGYGLFDNGMFDPYNINSTVGDTYIYDCKTNKETEAKINADGKLVYVDSEDGTFYYIGYFGGRSRQKFIDVINIKNPEKYKQLRFDQDGRFMYLFGTGLGYIHDNDWDLEVTGKNEIEISEKIESMSKIIEQKLENDPIYNLPDNDNGPWSYYYSDFVGMNNINYEYHKYIYGAKFGDYYVDIDNMDKGIGNLQIKHKGIIMQSLNIDFNKGEVSK